MFSHGIQQKVVLGKQNLSGKEEEIYASSLDIIHHIKETGIDIALIHLGYCQSLPKPDSNEMIPFKKAAGKTPISGYTTAETYFSESATYEVQFFDKIIIGNKTAEVVYFEMTNRKHWKKCIADDVGLYCFEN